jgi:glycosyltransferase involved in cell wall biosynthesis
VADGGSQDNTLAILREYEGRLRLKVIHTPGANISQGRNAAILAASGDLIASTDAGVRCEPDWLEKLTVPFAESAKSQASNPAPAPQAAAGFFRSDPQSAFELAMGATVLPEARDVDPQTYLPSSRSVAFRWSAWREVGGYPEWLDYSEDVVFDLRLRDKYGPFVFVPQAVVNFRPRGSLRAFARQYFRYARGDGKANLFPRLHAIRYFTYFVAAPLLVYAALTISPWFWCLGVVAGLAYVRLPLRRAWPRLTEWSWADRLKVLLWIPVIRVLGDAAKMAGYAVGVAWRLKVSRSLGKI